MIASRQAEVIVILNEKIALIGSIFMKEVSLCWTFNLNFDIYSARDWTGNVLSVDFVELCFL